MRLSDNKTQETLVRINKKYEKREANREGAALKAAQIERAIEKELLNRLKVGTFYKNIYNLDTKDFNEQLDQDEVENQVAYEMDENDDLESDEEVPGDLELNEEERQMLEMVDMEDIEEVPDKEKQLAGKKRKKPVEI